MNRQGSALSTTPQDTVAPRSSKVGFWKVAQSHIFWRMLIVIIAIAFLSVTAALTMAAYHYEKEAVTQINHSHNLLAGRMAKEMGLFFDQSVFQIAMIADILDVLYLNPEDARVTLNRAALNSSHITEIAYVNADGNTLATSSAKDEKVDFSVTEPFQHAIKGETWVSRVSLDKNGTPSVSISAPVHDVATPRGAVIAVMSLKKLWWWIDEINDISGSTLTILNQDTGVVVADQSKSAIGKRYEYWKGNPTSLFVNAEGGGRIFISFHDTPRINLTLALITHMDPFTSHINQLRYALIALGLSILLIAGLIAGAISWRSAMPILKIVEGMRAYAKYMGETRMSVDLPGEFKKVAVAFNEMLDAVEAKQKLIVQQESVARVGRLASILSHELRHGLHVIVNMVFMLDHIKQEMKDTINRVVQTLVTKISDIMDFTRAGAMVSSEVKADMVILQAAENVKYSEAAKDKKILVSNRKSELILQADGGKTVTAVSNMLRNSLEAECKTVTVSWTLLENGMVEFRVVDDGTGIAAENLGHVFEPFYSTKRKGFGIGLAMAELVAKGHGGRAYVHETSPSGTDIRIAIPLSPPHGDDGGDGGDGDKKISAGSGITQTEKSGV
jgi:signal transduction histidine kinase